MLLILLLYSSSELGSIERVDRKVQKERRGDEAARWVSHGRATGAPEALADILMAYCHLLSSLPVWLGAAMVLHFQNFQVGTCRGASPTKTFGVVPVVLALVALARVARVGVCWLLT